MRNIFAIACVLLSAGALALGQPRPKLPEGQAVPGLELSDFRLGGAEIAGGRMERVATAGQEFKEALRIRNARKPASVWACQIVARCPVAVKKGDVMLATFYGRALQSSQETGEGQTEFIFEGAAAPNEKSAEQAVSLGRQWKKVNVPFVVARDYGPNQAQVIFRAGYAPQTFEVGGLSVVNFQKQVKLRDLPGTPLTYGGREADAPWRKAAAERIEKIRKGDLSVVVTDAAGKPIPAAAVAVRMKRHAFGFGSAVTAGMLLDPSPDAEKYRERVKLFSRVVFENDLKWPSWERDHAQIPAALAWLGKNGIEVRGHNLVWPSWRYVPRDLQAMKNDPAALRKRINDHITEVASANAGKLVDWDVVNETYNNHDLMDVLGRSSMVEWFKLARAADPKATLYINDFSILTGGGQDTAHQDDYAKTIQYLIDQGAPIGGAGLQSHFGGRLTAPEKMLQILDRFGKFGVKLQATEFDIDITDEECQGDFMRDFMTTLFSHPAVDGIVMWGFWESRHWKPRAALWRSDWSIKPNGQAWLDLVRKQWWTDVAGQTDPAGKYQTRGFLGDYEIEVKAGGKTKVVEAKLERTGQTVKVTME